MDIKEIRVKKEELSSTLADLFEKFYKETGVSVEDIDIEERDDTDIRYGIYMPKNITVELEDL